MAAHGGLTVWQVWEPQRVAVTTMVAHSWPESARRAVCFIDLRARANSRCAQEVVVVRSRCLIASPPPLRQLTSAPWSAFESFKQATVLNFLSRLWPIPEYLKMIPMTMMKQTTVDRDTELTQRLRRLSL